MDWNLRATRLMRRVALPAGCVLAALTLSGPASAAVSSDFEVDEDGWTVDGGLLTHLATGGNPGGFIQADDDTLLGGNDFVAPEKFLGDWTAFRLGKVSFDLSQIAFDDSKSPNESFGTLQITSSGGGIGGRAIGDTVAEIDVVGDLSGDLGAWFHFEIPITAADFGIDLRDFADFLANITEVRLLGDSHSGRDEIVGLDNFQVNPVPVPAALPLLGTALFGLVGFRRFQRRRNQEST